MKRVFFRLRQALETWRWGRVFGHFGAGSRVGRHFMTSNPRLVHIGSNVFVNDFTCIEVGRPDGPSDAHPVVKIGDWAYIGRFCHISGVSSIQIDREVLIGDRVTVVDHSHCYEDVGRSIGSQGITPGSPVAIGEGSWLCDGCVVLPGVVIGRHCVVGANSVVNSSLPDFSVGVGSPARLVKRWSVERGVWVRSASNAHATAPYLEDNAETRSTADSDEGRG